MRARLDLVANSVQLVAQSIHGPLQRLFSFLQLSFRCGQLLVELSDALHVSALLGLIERLGEIRCVLLKFFRGDSLSG